MVMTLNRFTMISEDITKCMTTQIAKFMGPTWGPLGTNNRSVIHTIRWPLFVLYQCRTCPKMVTVAWLVYCCTWPKLDRNVEGLTKTTYKTLSRQATWQANHCLPTETIMSPFVNDILACKGYACLINFLDEYAQRNEAKDKKVIS